MGRSNRERAGPRDSARSRIFTFAASCNLLFCMKPAAENLMSIDPKDYLLQSYAMANRFATHYSAMRTTLSAASITLAYSQFLVPMLGRLSSTALYRSDDRVSATLAVVLGFVGLAFNYSFLRRTIACRAVMLSIESRLASDLTRHDDKLLGKPQKLWMAPGTLDKWKKEVFPIKFTELEDIFLRGDEQLRVQLRPFAGLANRLYLMLLLGPVFVFIAVWRDWHPLP